MISCYSVFLELIFKEVIDSVTELSIYLFCHYYLCLILYNTVKFLIVAASPIEAAPQTLKKLQFFYKMFFSF